MTVYKYGWARPYVIESPDGNWLLVIGHSCFFRCEGAASLECGLEHMVSGHTGLQKRRTQPSSFQRKLFFMFTRIFASTNTSWTQTPSLAPASLWHIWRSLYLMRHPLTNGACQPQINPTLQLHVEAPPSTPNPEEKETQH